MLQQQPDANEARRDFLYAIGLVLVVAILLVIVDAALQVSSFSGMSTRDQIEAFSRGVANVTVAALLLGAVAALAFAGETHRDRAHPLFAATLVLGAIVVVLALYSVVDVLTVHIPGPNDDSTFAIGLVHDSLKDRVTLFVPQVAAAAMALVAMVGANRIGNLFARGNGTDPDGWT